MSKKQDAAGRTADAIYPEGTMADAIQASKLAKQIRRAIRAAVKAERERIGHGVIDFYVEHPIGSNERKVLDELWTRLELVGKVKVLKGGE